MKSVTETRNILLVEDNPADAELVREWVSENHSDIQLTWVEDGAAAVDYLQRRQVPNAEWFPGLILLDINLPRMSGLDVLRKIKGDGIFKKIPVVMLTSSIARDDVDASYLSHANAYVQKSLSLETFFESLGSIHGMFFETAVPPEL